MIQRDYIMRMIRELIQVLARVAALREISEYGQALAELDALLAKLRGRPVDEPPDVEDWIAFCQEGEGSVEERLAAVADVWRERGDLLRLEHRSAAAHHSFCLALGLYLERVNLGMITTELIDRVGECLAGSDSGSLPPAVLRRLGRYYEGRGWWARAEDVFFEWLETGDPQAVEAGFAFYGRLQSLSAAELASGNLSPEEVRQGTSDFQRRAQGN